MATGLSDHQLEAMARTMRALGHETRLRLVDTLLAKGEKSVGELEVLTGTGQPGLSQQLAILRKAGLVATRRAAKQVYYSIAPETVELTARFLVALANLDRLEAAGPPAPPPPRPAGVSAAMFAKIL